MAHRLPRAGVALLLTLLVLAAPPAAAAQSDSALADDFRALLSALEAVQTQLDANDVARARPFYDVFENLWQTFEDSVRNRWGTGYHTIVDAMRSLRSALNRSPADPAAARVALAELRGTLNGFRARVASDGGAGTPTAAAPAAAAASTSASTSADASNRPSEADCARYSAQAALPYFNYALALAGNAPVPGIPPAQAMAPMYAQGPGLSGLTAGPYGSVYPYFPLIGPGATAGGAGVGLGVPTLNSAAVYAGLLAGGQLTPFQSAVSGSLARSDLIALVAQQNQEIDNRIGLGTLQQGVLGNQFNFSNARQNWVNAYLGFVDRARDIALSLCGRIP